MQTTDEDVVKTLVLEFVRDMNAWEQCFYEEWSHHLRSMNRGWPEDKRKAHEEMNAEIISRHHAAYTNIFERSCTNRKRSYGGPSKSLSARFPTKYDTLDEKTLERVSVKSSSRAEAHFQANGAFTNYKFLFVVLKKQGCWRIDSYKYQFSNEEKWNVGIL